MTLILQSNKVATRSLGNIDGIVGPRDFTLFSDFSLGRHRLATPAGRVDKGFSEIFDFSRNSEATFINSRGELMSAGVGSPRLEHNIPQLGVRGLLLEKGRVNSFMNATAPATQTIALVNGATYAVVFSVVGSGSLTVTGDITQTYGKTTPDGTALTITEDTPGSAFLSVAAGQTGNINVQVNGSLSFVQVERTDRPWTPSSRIISSSRERDDDKLSVKSAVLASLLSASGDFTVAMHVVNSYGAAYKPDGSNQMETRPVFQVLDSGGDHLALANRVSGSGSRTSTVRTYMGGSELSLTSVSGQPEARAWTAVLGRGGNAMFAAVNGFINSGSTNVSPSFRPDKLLLGNFESWTTRGGLFGVVTKLVVYPRMLSSDEIRLLSTSWA